MKNTYGKIMAWFVFTGFMFIAWTLLTVYAPAHEYYKIISTALSCLILYPVIGVMGNEKGKISLSEYFWCLFVIWIGVLPLMQVAPYLNGPSGWSNFVFSVFTAFVISLLALFYQWIVNRHGENNETEAESTPPPPTSSTLEEDEEPEDK